MMPLQKLQAVLFRALARGLQSWADFTYRLAEKVEHGSLAGQDSALNASEQVTATTDKMSVETNAESTAVQEGAAVRPPGEPPVHWLERINRSGPPEHWLAYIRQKAPHLLDASGSGTEPSVVTQMSAPTEPVANEQAGPGQSASIAAALRASLPPVDLKEEPIETPSPASQPLYSEELPHPLQQEHDGSHAVASFAGPFTQQPAAGKVISEKDHTWGSSLYSPPWQGGCPKGGGVSPPVRTTPALRATPP